MDLKPGELCTLRAVEALTAGLGNSFGGVDASIGTWLQYNARDELERAPISVGMVLGELADKGLLAATPGIGRGVVDWHLTDEGEAAPGIYT